MTTRNALSVAAALCALATLSPAAPEPNQEPKARPVITAANADRVRPVAEFDKATTRNFRPGPGRGELTLFNRGKSLEVVDEASFRSLRKVADARPLDCAASKDGRLAWIERDGHAFIQDAAGGKPLKFEAGKDIWGLAWSPDGKLLAIGDTINKNPKVEGSGETMVRLWDAKGQLVRSLPATKLGFTIPVFSPDGELLVVGCVNRNTRIFEVATGKLLHTLPRRLATQTTGVASRPDGKVLASVHADGDIELWDIATGTLLRRTNDGRIITSVGWGSKGDVLVTASSEKVVLWDAERLVKLKELKPPFEKAFEGLARFSADGTRIVSLWATNHTDAADRKFVVWAVPDGNR